MPITTPNNLHIAVIEGDETQLLKNVLICAGHTSVSFETLTLAMGYLAAHDVRIEAIIVDRDLNDDEIMFLNALLDFKNLPVLVRGKLETAKDLRNRQIRFLPKTLDNPYIALLTWLATLDVPQRPAPTVSRLFTLLYISQANAQADERELMDILSVSRKVNHRLGITGVLVYSKGWWLQVLEGEFNAVTSLFFDRIQRDKRHTHASPVVMTYIDQRHFANWDMGYYSTETDVPFKSSFTDLAKHPAGAYVQSLLKQQSDHIAYMLKPDTPQTGAS